MPQNWLQILTVGTNLSVLILGFKILRYLVTLDLKVNMMWSHYKKQVGIDSDSGDD